MINELKTKKKRRRKRSKRTESLQDGKSIIYYTVCVFVCVRYLGHVTPACGTTW